jgi:hypothetical protein
MAAAAAGTVRVSEFTTNMKRRMTSRVHLYVPVVVAGDKTAAGFFCPASSDKYFNMCDFTIQPGETHLLVDHGISANPPKRLTYKIRLAAEQDSRQISVGQGTQLSKLLNVTGLHVELFEWSLETGQLW